MSRWSGWLLVLISLLPIGGCRSYGLPAGSAVPKLQLDGWINGPAPSEETLRGKVIVLDIFASW